MLQATNLDLIQTKNGTQNPLGSTASHQLTNRKEKEKMELHLLHQQGRPSSSWLWRSTAISLRFASEIFQIFTEKG